MSAYVPAYVPQLDGSQYAGLNCTCAVGAMCLDRATTGKNTATGRGIRIATGDHTGGTTQRQVASALENYWNIDLNVDITVPPSTAVERLDKGMGMMLAGQSSATRGTKWSASETFGGNHQWWDNERRKNSQVAGGYEHRIMDPLGDGRRPGIADFRHGGLWVPEAVVKDFARRLNVSEHPATSYVPLGNGKWYSVFTADTEPHFELKYGAKSTMPPVSRHINVPAGRVAIVRSGPGRKYKDVLHLKDGARFIYCQAVVGQSIAGQNHWYGNIDGTRWVHQSALV